MIGYQSLHSLGTRSFQVSPCGRRSYPRCDPRHVGHVVLPWNISDYVLSAGSYFRGHTQLTEAGKWIPFSEWGTTQIKTMECQSSHYSKSKKGFVKQLQEYLTEPEGRKPNQAWWRPWTGTLSFRSGRPEAWKGLVRNLSGTCWKLDRDLSGAMAIVLFIFQVSKAWDQSKRLQLCLCLLISIHWLSKYLLSTYHRLGVFQGTGKGNQTYKNHIPFIPAPKSKCPFNSEDP